MADKYREARLMRGRPKYPWRTVKVGESFFLPYNPARARVMAKQRFATTGRSFEVQKIDGGSLVRRTA